MFLSTTQTRQTFVFITLSLSFLYLYEFTRYAWVAGSKKNCQKDVSCPISDFTKFSNLIPLNKLIIRVRGLGYPERLISSLGAGACGVVGAGMFVVVSVVVVVVVSVSVVVVASLGWVAPRGRATHPRPTLGPVGPMG